MVLASRAMLLSMALFANTASVVASADEKSDAMRPPAIAAQCGECHGVNGNSTSETVPRLNGQQAGYLASRLHALRYPASQTPKATHAMWNLTTHIGDDDVPVIAKYFASQTPTPASKNDGRLAATGREIYARGAFQEVPACQSCHGAHGEGHGSTPRLAGQHSQYLQDQLLAFRLTLRPHPIMSFQNKYLTDAQIKALAAYLANQ